MCVRSLDDADCDWIRKDLTIARNQIDDCGVPARHRRDLHIAEDSTWAQVFAAERDAIHCQQRVYAGP